MKVYFSCNESYFHTKREKFCFGGIRALFESQVVDSIDFRHSDVVERFDALSDCEILVLLPKEWELDQNQVWEIKVWDSFHRPTYLITPENTILRATLIKKEAKVEISEQQALEDQKTTN